MADASSLIEAMTDLSCRQDDSHSGDPESLTHPITENTREENTREENTREENTRAPCGQFPSEGDSVAESPDPEQVGRPDKFNSKRTTKSIDLNTVLKVVEDCKLEGDFQKLLSFISTTFSSPKALRHAFIRHPSQPLQEATCTCNDVHVSMNLVDVRKAYEVILSTNESGGNFIKDVLKAFASAFSLLHLQLANESQLADEAEDAFTKDPNYLNPILIAIELPLLRGLSCEQVKSCLHRLCDCIHSLSEPGKKRLKKVLSAVYDAGHLGRLLEHLHRIITWSCQELHPENMISVLGVVHLVYRTSLYGGVTESDETIEAENSALRDKWKIWRDMNEATGVELLWEQSELASEVITLLYCKEPMLPCDRFINDAFSELANERMNEQFFCWMTMNRFMLRAKHKRKLMYVHNNSIMCTEQDSALSNKAALYLPFHARRSHLVATTNENLEFVYNGSLKELHKPLRVDFEGEPGLDEGGVSKEFFQLYVKELLNPNMGMFSMDDGSDYFWINPVSPAGDKEFTAVGLVLGLAIYNGVILDVQLPPVLYRKLAGMLGCLKDLESTHPYLYCSLQSIMTYEGDTADLMTYFSVSQKGSTEEVENFELINGGSEVLVTNDNKQTFVELYADFLLNRQVERQFAAFALGFHMVTDRTLLHVLFTPEEMEIVVSGEKNYDFHALQNSTKYESGYTEDYPVIKQFWEIAHEMDEEQKRQLLKFTTGSDRVPMGGLSELGFKITKNGPDTDRLPTASTCFNILLLPQYSTKEKLKERLLKAIEYCEGFGLI